MVITKNFNGNIILIISVVIFILVGVGVFGEILSDRHYNDAGFDCLKKNALVCAEENFLKAIQINSSNKYYYNNIAVVFIRKKQYKKAYSSLKKAISIDVNYTRGLVNLSICCFYLRSYYEAYQYYCRSVKSDPDYVKKRFRHKKVMEQVEKRQLEVPKDRTVSAILRYLRENDDVFSR